MSEAGLMLALSTMLVAASVANADIRPLLRHQGFDGPLNGRETINYAGHIREGRDDYQIFTYHGIFRAAVVDHGVNRIIILLNGSKFRGQYDIPMRTHCTARTQKVICTSEKPNVIEFTRRGPPTEIVFDGEVEHISLQENGASLNDVQSALRSCGSAADRMPSPAAENVGRADAAA